ncbi:hypothetical protein [Rhizobium sp. AN80A]|uniref:hypothetical protein n=1 Tax=Rhizobium sp. AN80A TaxID=3040673 RepID=UPI0024B3A919|nr:hypothetical protein [Rhizobium sp. AN80A]
MRFDTRRMSGRVAVSLVVAVFAYLGLLFGGNLALGPARGPNAVSSSSRDGQPQEVSAHEIVRGMLAGGAQGRPEIRDLCVGRCGDGGSAAHQARGSRFTPAFAINVLGLSRA